MCSQMRKESPLIVLFQMKSMYKGRIELFYNLLGSYGYAWKVAIRPCLSPRTVSSLLSYSFIVLRGETMLMLIHHHHTNQKQKKDTHDAHLNTTVSYTCCSRYAIAMVNSNDIILCCTSDRKCALTQSGAAWNAEIEPVPAGLSLLVNNLSRYHTA
jgi:hypothetical protein